MAGSARRTYPFAWFTPSRNVLKSLLTTKSSLATLPSASTHPCCSARTLAIRCEPLPSRLTPTLLSRKSDTDWYLSASGAVPVIIALGKHNNVPVQAAAYITSYQRIVRASFRNAGNERLGQSDSDIDCLAAGRSRIQGRQHLACARRLLDQLDAGFALEVRRLVYVPIR